MQTMLVRADYIWLDAGGNVREKTRIDTTEDFPTWTFDGSSTGQSETRTSDLLLKPVRTYTVPASAEFKAHHIVLCEVMNADGTPHATNHRHRCMEIMAAAEKEEPLFGIEQEYVITQLGMDREIAPYRWYTPAMPYPKAKQGPFYCSVGGTRAFGREIVEDHLRACLAAGIKLCGVNAEVMPSQWEFQIGPLAGDRVADDLIVARYLLAKVAEKHRADISFHPKPVVGWNGSGGHTNFSTKAMRDVSAEAMDAIMEGCRKLEAKHEEHMAVYGADNDKRMCGAFETSDPSKFSYGVGDRSCSVRIPQHVAIAGKGYLEDRRPAANMDPYLVCGKIVETVCL